MCRVVFVNRIRVINPILSINLIRVINRILSIHRINYIKQINPILSINRILSIHPILSTCQLKSIHPLHPLHSPRPLSPPTSSPSPAAPTPSPVPLSLPSLPVLYRPVDQEGRPHRGPRAERDSPLPLDTELDPAPYLAILREIDQQMGTLAPALSRRRQRARRRAGLPQRPAGDQHARERAGERISLPSLPRSSPAPPAAG